jgi:hypothetical protein
MRDWWPRRIWDIFFKEWQYKRAKLKEEEHLEWELIARNIRRSNEGVERSGPKTPPNAPFILSWLRHLFLFLSLVSYSYWLSLSQIHQEKIRKQLDFKPYRNADIYVTIWLAFEVLAAVTISVSHIQIVFLAVLFGYRLLDIFQSWINQFLLSSKWNAINVNRSLVIAFVYYLEIIIMVAIIRITFDSNPLKTFSDSLSSSVNPMIANPGQTPSPIQYVQIMFAVLFAAVVVQHVVGRLSNKNGGEYD